MLRYLFNGGNYGKHGNRGNHGNNCKQGLVCIYEKAKCSPSLQSSNLKLLKFDEEAM